MSLATPTATIFEFDVFEFDIDFAFFRLRSFGFGINIKYNYKFKKLYIILIQHEQEQEQVEQKQDGGSAGVRGRGFRQGAGDEAQDDQPGAGGVVRVRHAIWLGDFCEFDRHRSGGRVRRP